MANRKAKLPPDRMVQDFAYRAGKVRLATPDGIRLVLATESPIRVWDFGERQVVNEVLRMDGMEFPQQIPLLNSHNRDEARDVIGSIRDLQVSGDRLEGTAHFASNPVAQEVRKLYEEGHLTDFSIGFQADSIEKVKRDDSRNIGGRKYAGPMRIVTKARVKEGSAVAIGADENAKALQEYPALRAYLCPDLCLKESKMDELRNFALTRGMPADTPDAGILDWMADNLRSAAEDPVTPPIIPPVVVQPEVDPVTAERARGAEITRMCGDRGISQQQAASYIRSTLSVGEVAIDILRKQNGRSVSPQTGAVGQQGRIEPCGPSETEKFMDGARGALISRCLMGVNINNAEQHANGKYDLGGTLHQTNTTDHVAIEGVKEVRRLVESPISRDFRNVGLCEMARMFVEQSGKTVRGMSKQQIVQAAFRLDRELIQRDDAAYHTTGSFTNVLLDAANKTLLMAYEEANVTYPLWVRQAPSTADYKTINRIRLGEVPSPDIVPENAHYGEVAVTDSKESYTPDKYGNLFSISLEAIVNDDLNAISRIPAQQGYSMRRKINQVCYAVLTANAAMSDSIALFHASSHGANLDAVALSATSLNTGFTVMMTQTGLNSGVILNVTPRYLIVPPSLAATAYRLTMSMGDPTSAAATTEDAARPGYNSGVINLYGPQGPRSLMPIVDAQLEANSATAWWLAAESNQIDTVEITFLQGEETPYVERKDEFCVDAVRYKIRQTFGAKAIDYRGLYQGNA